VLAIEHDVAFPPDLRYGWLGSALECLRRADPPGLRAWLLDRCLSPEPEHFERTSTALVALGGLAGLDGPARREVLVRAQERLLPLWRRSEGHRPTADLFRDFCTLAGAYAGAQRASDFPRLTGSAIAKDLEDVLAWLRRHASPEDPLWR
jgi:hypothetical protein